MVTLADLRVVVGGLAMRSPVVLASGTVGYGVEYAGLVDFEAVGAVVTKTITLAPRAGNRPPRLCETPSGLLNAIGLENVGLPAFLSEKLPESASLPTPLVASVAGQTPDEFAALAAAVGAREEVGAVELNISCPNVARPRRPLWADPEATAAVVAAARAETGKPLFVKLSPAVADAESVAQAAVSAGADALVVANTMPGMRVDIAKRRPALGAVTGGLSGAALLPVNLALVWKVVGCVQAPVIGSGGVSSAEDALEYLMAGATAVEIGTALFRNPATASRIVEGLAAHMERDGIERVTDYVGLAREATRRC
jgi:dihydroorotate dehydrogenase (NAD+) catalytic subunit